MLRKSSYLLSIVFVVGLALSVPVRAELFLVEHFDYPVGSDLDGQVAGKGAWVTDGGGYQVLNDDGLGDDATSSLQYTGLKDSQGGRLIHDGDCDYILTTPITGEGNSLYLSMLLKPTEMSTSYFVMFATPDSVNGSLGRLRGEDSGGQQQLGVSLRGSSRSEWSDKTVALGETVLVVMKLTMAPGSDNDTVELWVNPEVGQPETPADAISMVDPGNDVNSGTGIHGFRTRDRGVQELDEIRLGTTWDDVIGSLGGAGVASAPNPGDEVDDVPRDVVLSWTPGEFAAPANGHKVYFSESFDDVNDGVDGVAQTATSYTPAQRLDFGKTYYWRVDEIEADGATIHEGDVWSFTVELLAYPITGENIIVTASSFEEGKSPENTVNGSGLVDNVHSTVLTDMWLTAAGEPSPAWIKYDFDKIYKLHEILVWNYNGESFLTAVGLKDVIVEYSSDDVNWVPIDSVNEFDRASGLDDYAPNTTIPLDDIPVKSVKIYANSNWSGNFSDQFGLSEVRFLYIPVHARDADPNSGATEVDLDMFLEWGAGRDAAEHNVYISPNEQDVIDGNITATTVTETIHGPLALDLGTTYYWRVDEVNDAETPSIWQGDIWNFTTKEYFVIDDFEAYNDLNPDDPESNRIFLTWIGGDDQPANGSQVGNDTFPFAELTIINGGNQSMPLYYNKTGDTTYSEATMTLTSQRDWTFRGAEELALWFRGYPATSSTFIEGPAETYTMTARSDNISDPIDSFHYVYKQLSGVGSIIVKVESVTETSTSAKAGVMIRETLDPDSKHAMVFSRPDGATRFRRRDETGESLNSVDNTLAVPHWVKLERDASGSLTASHSTDGINFVPIDDASLGSSSIIQMSNVVYIGLALSSNNPEETCTAVFSEVSTTGTVTGQWQSRDIGIVANDPEPMYVAIANSTGELAAVYHDDANAATTDVWTKWVIPLQKFADQGVNLADVDRIAIGLGDKNSVQVGGSGTIFIDDIGVGKSAP